jgi:hypothetical protein
VAIVNRNESSVIEEKVIQIARRYPQALYYPFKVVESNIDVNVLDADIEPTPLFTKLKNFFQKSFKNLNTWIEALEGLVYPEHRFKYWHQIISDLVSSSTAGDKAVVVSKVKMQEIVKMMIKDIASDEKALVGKDIGGYNRKFAEKYSSAMIKAFG